LVLKLFALRSLIVLDEMAEAGTSSSGSSFTNTASAMATGTMVHRACEAAKQLRSLWSVSESAQLLDQLPPAATPTGAAREALQSSNMLMMQLGADLTLLGVAADTDHPPQAMSELLQCLFVDAQLPELLAKLLVWLQQRPEFLLLQQPEAAALLASVELSTGNFWLGCLMCSRYLFVSLLKPCSRGDQRVTQYAKQAVETFEELGKCTGEWH
jgi:hypothetical protein